MAESTVGERLEQIKNLLGTTPDHELALEVGTHASVVARFRRSLGIPAGSQDASAPAPKRRGRTPGRPAKKNAANPESGSVAASPLWVSCRTSVSSVTSMMARETNTLEPAATGTSVRACDAGASSSVKPSDLSVRQLSVMLAPRAAGSVTRK